MVGPKDARPLIVAAAFALGAAASPAFAAPASPPSGGGAVAQASLGGSGSPPATRSPQAKVLQGGDPVGDEARSWLAQLQAGSIDRTQLTPAFNATLSAEAVAAFRRKLAPLGEPSSFKLRDTQPTEGVTAYTYAVTWKGGSAYYVFALDDRTGKVAGLRVLPGPP
jgi:hypothetical protein